MAGESPYFDRYRKFFAEREKAEGYEFHEATAENVPPPKVTFLERLRWWTLNRGERIKKIRAERDRRQQEIFDIKRSQSRSTHS